MLAKTSLFTADEWRVDEEVQEPAEECLDASFLVRVVGLHVIFSEP
jgi:hypothetical protein